MLNVTAEEPRVGAGVLLRAIEPLHAPCAIMARPTASLSCTPHRFDVPTRRHACSALAETRLWNAINH
jgi:3-methyladenine DNA glycosylase Mpg